MRIVSGILRNRRFQVPKEAVRPTKEQVREAVFSSLGGWCEGWRVLDLFAGAGGLGLEAWSRGAEEVLFVEKNPKVWRVLSENVEQLREDGLGGARCVRGDAFAYLRTSPAPFDIIFADPPYDLPDAMERTLRAIAEHSALAPDGRVVYELRSSDRFEVPAGWELLRDKAYGAARVLVLKQRKGDEADDEPVGGMRGDL